MTIKTVIFIVIFCLFITKKIYTPHITIFLYKVFIEVMCELLGMSANTPTDIRFSFSELMQRGGLVGLHRDGWGITFYDGKAERTFKEPDPCSHSLFAKLVSTYPLRSISVVAHIRQANSGGLRLENTHPFSQHLWRRSWTFAHNGQLSHYKKALPIDNNLPIGTTDSEWAFRYIMEQLQGHYAKQPTTLAACKYIARTMRTIARHGVFNALMTEGKYTIAYCTTELHYITRRAPFTSAHLQSLDWRVNFEKETSPDDVVTIIATKPLTTNETWYKMQKNECILFREGEIIFQKILN